MPDVAAANQVACKGHDDTVALQTAFEAAGNIQVTGNCKITKHLVYYSNSTINLTGATITFDQSTADWLLVNDAGMSTNETPAGWGAQRSFSDATTKSGSTTISSDSADFTSSDLGQSIDCLTAAGAGANLDLHTRIAAIDSAASITVDDTAGEDLSSATCYIFRRDSNIIITGGTLIVSGTLTPSTSFPMVKAKSINNVAIENMSLDEQGTTGMYHLVFQDTYQFQASGIEIQAIQMLQDGIDIIGPALRGVVSNISGYSGDDFVVLTTSYVGQLIDSSTNGTIADMTLENLHGESAQGEGGATLFVRAPGNINNVKISGVVSETAPMPDTQLLGFGIGVKIGYDSQDPGTPGSINNLSAQDVTGWFRGPAISFGIPLVSNVTLQHISDSNPNCAPRYDLIMLSNISTVLNLDIRAPIILNDNCAALVGVAPGGKVTYVSEFPFEIRDSPEDFGEHIPLGLPKFPTGR